MGDPAFILAVPVVQWQSEFVVLTPDSYKTDYINIVAPDGADVSVDGVAVPSSAWLPVGATAFRVFRAAVADGVHEISATTPVSVVVYGYDDDVSYGYPGAVGLKQQSE